MLTIPKDSLCEFSIIGLDPGSNAFGIAVLNINIETKKIVSSDAWTIFAERLAGKNNWVEEVHGGRVNRILAIEENLLAVFLEYNPNIIATESPFIHSSFPAAGIALTEVLSAIRRAVIRYDSWKKIFLIPPSSVKNGVGAGGGVNKVSVRDKVLELTELNYSGVIRIEDLDEHAIDSLAVAYTKYKQLIET
jgi:Holliday junction resolvasome RuvABC endonuclease subunit